VRGGMIPRAVSVVFISTFCFLSALVDVERTLAVRRCESSVNAPYLSLRVCNELVRVGLGEGIRVIEIGRGLTRASCTAGGIGPLTILLCIVVAGGVSVES